MPTANYVDREEASKILKVSTRTVDRYLRKHKFRTRKDGRRVLIKRNDVDFIIQKNIGHFVDFKQNPIGEGNPEKKESIIAIKDIKIEKIKEKSTNSVEEKIYKSLYTETKGDLKEKQERLEAATYRVGQLESQVKNMVPLLDFNSKEKELREAQITLEQKALEGNQVAERMQQRLRAERVAKWIYISLVGLLLVAEPILFLLWAFS